jgi:outer membrane protein assembly factor BamB
MIRFVPGPSWKLNPGYVSALRGLASDQAAGWGESPGVLDALHIEVDGVPIGRHLGEGDLFAEIDELVAAALRLCREPAGGGQISLAGGKAELVLGRRGPRACLSIVSLARPARLLAGELEVELAALAQAVAGCAEAVCRDLRAINPLLAASPLHRRLARGARALRKAAVLASRASAPCPAASPLVASPARELSPGPAVRLALEDPHGRIEAYRGSADLFALLAPGELTLVGLGGAEPVRIPGPPFLALTELARAAGAILSAAQSGDPALEVALPGSAGPLRLCFREGSASAEGSHSGSPSAMALARAFLEAALDFAGALCARNPAFQTNPYLGSMADGAREKLEALRELEAGDLFAEPKDFAARRSPCAPAPAPLSTCGSLRRLRFELAWRTALPGGPARSLSIFARTVASLGEEHLAFLEPRSGALLETYLGRAALGPPGALLASGGRLIGISEAGRALWVRDLPERAAIQASVGCGECRTGRHGSRAALMAFDGNRLAAVLALTGRTAWRIEAPHVLKLKAAARGDRVFAAADTGVLYGLNARTGEVAFRVRTGISPEGPLCISGGSLAFIGRAEGALWLVGLDSRTGKPLFRAELPLDEAPELWSFARKWVVAGARGASPCALGFGSSGKRAFALELAAGGGAPPPAPGGHAVGLSLRDGSIHALGALGARLWSLGPKGAELARAVRPLVRRGVLLAPGDGLRALAPETGAVLSELPPTPGLVALAAGPELEVFAADDEGVVTCLRLGTHLSVVR